MQETFQRPFFLFLALTLIHFFGLAQNTEEPYRMKTVVIDAGHGGKDPGNLGTGRYKAREKDIALDVALRVGSYIKKQFPEINVMYTRATDVFIGLNERADIANKAKADLFISIHCNAFAKVSSNGVETFVLGLHRNEDNLQVAMKENSAIFLEDDYKTKYEGFDPNSAESIIALTIMQSAFLSQSLALSSYVQKQFAERVGRRNRGVKQAGFLVLRKTTMPSVLIELGFLTNAAEEDFLNSENGKSYMSSAIFRGFKEYKEVVEDPLPEGQVLESKKEEENIDVEKEQKKKLAEEKQTKIKVKADSLEQLKQNLLDEQKKREKDLADAKNEKKLQMQAKADSLVIKKQELLAAKKKREDELMAAKAKAEEERLAKLEAARIVAEKAVAEEKRNLEGKKKNAEEAKQQATEILEEIKELKEEELAEVKQQVIVDAEKKRLEEIKKQKEQELAAAQKAENDMLAKQKMDSIALAKKMQESLLVQEAKNKAKKDSIAATKKANVKLETVTIDREKAVTPEEAELLFLQLRKRQLEQRIAQLQGNNVAELKHYDQKKNEPVVEKSQERTVVYDSGEVLLKVQVSTSAKALRKNSPQFKGLDVSEYQQGGLYKYTVGISQNFEEITKLQGELRNLGFKGAFVVAFKDGERIKVAEARKLLNQ